MYLMTFLMESSKFLASFGGLLRDPLNWYFSSALVVRSVVPCFSDFYVGLSSNFQAAEACQRSTLGVWCPWVVIFVFGRGLYFVLYLVFEASVIGEGLDNHSDHGVDGGYG